ncbi:MAG: hypothetical protein IJ196_07115 [Prevotella sp.]|nr:hypothetical protein [Prevotella sp.]
MKRNQRIAVGCCILLVMAMQLAGCRGGARQEFNELLISLAGDDQTIDEADWTAIADYLDGQKAHFGSFFKGGKLDRDEVEDYVEDYFEGLRPPVKVAFTVGNKPIGVKFYLERSGSMVGYDAAQGDGSFKAAIVSMLNNLPGQNDDHRIFVVNSEVTEYSKGFSQFVSERNIFEATKGLGDASYTDFARIFETLLDETDDSGLSILVTDMIYSTRSMAGLNPQKVFAEAEGMTQAVFKSQVKDQSMLVIKMNASYSGLYYPYNSSKGGVSYNGQRPYYIVIVGSDNVMKRLTTSADYAAFSRFADLRGYENMWLFTADDLYEPYYSLLLSSPDIRGRFRPERGQMEQITSIEGLAPDHDAGDIRLALAVDLSGMLIDEAYLTNPKNYTIVSDDEVEIIDIKPVSKADNDPSDKEYLGTSTHIMVLSLADVTRSQEVEIRLKKQLPQWIGDSSSDDDTNTSAPGFANTTFGLKYLMQGIANSYRRQAENDDCYFELELNFKK